MQNNKQDLNANWFDLLTSSSVNRIGIIAKGFNIGKEVHHRATIGFLSPCNASLVLCFDICDKIFFYNNFFLSFISFQF